MQKKSSSKEHDKLSTPNRKAMLVLSRSRNQSIIIGDDITLTVFGVDGGDVKIGVNAPNSIAVHRDEVYASITRKRKET